MAQATLTPQPGGPDPRVAAGLAAIRAELELPAAFPPGVATELAGMQGSAGADWELVGAGEREDLRALAFVTLDPPESRDLDQAFVIEPHPAAQAGAARWTLHYAIADVAAHVRPGGAIEAESLLRAETVYLPDARIPLHPPELSEDAASLLPQVDRLAVVWTLSVDEAGELLATQVRRATVRCTAKLAYSVEDSALLTGQAHEQIQHLAELGPALVAAAQRRGAIDLPDRAQGLTPIGDGQWQLAWEPDRIVERWNAQLSLLTGRAAAALMLSGGAGLLRTLPPPTDDAIGGVADAAAALGVAWERDRSLGEQLAALDPADPVHAALIDRARALLRGAGYLVLSNDRDSGAGANPLPNGKVQPVWAPEVAHAAVGGPYAHVTAPLRRLGDRYATECALAAARGAAVPAWVTVTLPQLPDALAAGGRRGGAAGRAALDLVEALALEPHVGGRFEVAVVGASREGATVVLEAPPVVARCDGKGLRPGTRATVTLTEAEPQTRRVRFSAP